MSSISAPVVSEIITVVRLYIAMEEVRHSDPFEAWLEWLTIKGYAYVEETGKGSVVVVMEG